MELSKTVKRIFISILGIFVVVSLLIYFALYYGTPPFAVRNDIQAFLDSNYKQKFKLISIEKAYSPDLFHQFTGYKISVTDSSGLAIDNIYIQNPQGYWRFYRGTEIIEK